MDVRNSGDEVMLFAAQSFSTTSTARLRAMRSTR